MTETVGVIDYIVRADLSDVISSSNEFDKSLKSTTNSVKKTDDAVSKLNTSTTKVADGVRKATSGMTSMRSASQNLGYQLQDIAVQLQSGTSAFAVFGQQGSQIASIFGPGGAVIGAIIAIAAAIGGTLVKSIQGANIEFDAMKDKVMDLTASQRELAKIEIEGKIQETTEKLKEYNKEYSSGMVAGNIFYAGEKGAVQYKAAQEVLNKELSGYKDRLSELSGTGKNLANEFNGTKDAIKIQTLAITEGERAAALYAAKLSILAKAKETGAGSKSVEDEIKNQSELINKFYDLKDVQEKEEQQKRQAEKAIKSSASELKKEATERDNNNQKIQEATRETEKLRTEYANLKINQDGTTESSTRLTKATAELEAMNQLNKKSVDDQVSALATQLLAQDKIKASYDQQVKAVQMVNSLSKQFNPVGQVTNDYEKQLKDLQAYKNMELITEQDFIAQKEALNYQYEQNRLAAAEAYFAAQSAGNAFMMDSLNALSMASTNALAGLMSGTMSVTEAMQSFANVILNQAVGALVQIGINYVKNMILADTMAAAEKARQAANAAALAASVSAQVGMTTALAAQAAYASTAAIPIVGPAAAPAAAAAAGTAAGSLGAPAITLAPIAGARRYGGPVNPGSMHPVNESGNPEIMNTSSGQYLLPNKRGEVVSNSDATNSGSGVTINVNNSASNVVSATASYDEQSRTVTLAVQEVARQLASNTGIVSRAAKSGLNVSGRTS